MTFKVGDKVRRISGSNDTRREVVPGVYGRVWVGGKLDSGVVIVCLTNSFGNGTGGQHLDASELKAAAAVLLELAGALSPEENLDA